VYSHAFSHKSSHVCSHEHQGCVACSPGSNATSHRPFDAYAPCSGGNCACRPFHTILNPKPQTLNRSNVLQATALGDFNTHKHTAPLSLHVYLHLSESVTLDLPFPRSLLSSLPLSLHTSATRKDRRIRDHGPARARLYRRRWQTQARMRDTAPYAATESVRAHMKPPANQPAASGLHPGASSARQCTQRRAVASSMCTSISTRTISVCAGGGRAHHTALAGLALRGRRAQSHTRISEQRERLRRQHDRQHSRTHAHTHTRTPARQSQRTVRRPPANMPQPACPGANAAAVPTTARRKSARVDCIAFMTWKSQ
jgi:hypothetical protein